MREVVETRGNVHILKHPLLRHQLSAMRMKETSPGEFRRLLGELSRLMAYEVTHDMSLAKIPIETPLEKMDGTFVDEKIVVVSIMRAGNGMLDGVMQMLPFASVGHIGIYRDKFIKSTVEYYFRMPKDIEKRRTIVLDPMLATGATAVAAIDRLKQYRVGPISFVCLLASPVGIETIHASHPDVHIYCVSLERELNAKGYILPGIGDAGDRLYDTM